jgi:hypothetical protein
MNNAVTAQNIVREIEHTIDVVRIRKLVHELAQMVPDYVDPTRNVTVIKYPKEKRFEILNEGEIISFGGLDVLDIALVQVAPCTVKETLVR